MNEDAASLVACLPLVGLSNLTDKHPPVRTEMVITISMRYRVLPKRILQKLVEFLLKNGMQLSTVLVYRPALDICKSRYIKARRQWISTKTIEQIFTNVVITKKLNCDLDGQKQKVRYYSLADLKYDLKSNCVLPLDTVEAKAPTEAENTSSEVAVDLDKNGNGDTDEETETDGEFTVKSQHKTVQDAEDHTDEETETDEEFAVNVFNKTVEHTAKYYTDEEPIQLENLPETFPSSNSEH